MCHPRLKIIELCDGPRFFKINIVLLSLSLLYLRKYRLKKTMREGELIWVNDYRKLMIILMRLRPVRNTIVVAGL